METESESVTASGPGEDSESLPPLDYAITAAAVIFWLYMMWEISDVATIQRPFFAVAFLCGILLIYLLTEAKESILDRDYLDLVLLGAIAVVLIVATVYILQDYDAFYRRQGRAFDHEYWLAWLVIAVILYLTWRSYGNVFLLLIGGTMIYALYGNYVPGLFGHGGISTTFMLQMLITDLAGFYGSLTQLTAVWIAPFLLYAGLLFAFGAFELILRVAIYSGKFISSGVAQTAVIASAIIGSVNGSKAANAGMTGSFTIPTMMNAGLRGRTAAGIEGSASMLGQVLPPVMGAAVFVMASTLGIAYVDAVIAGLIPAFILIGCILLAVHYTSVTEIGAQRMRFEDYFDEPLTRSEKIVEGTRFGVPFFILIFTLGYLQWTVPTAAFWTVVTMIVLGITTPVLQSSYGVLTRSDPEETSLSAPAYTLLDEIRHVIDGCRRGAIILAPIAIILAAVNGMIDLLMTTGMPSRIAIMLMQISGGVLIVAVLFGMGVCIVMGIGMPTVAAYVIVSTLVAPTFIQVFELPHLAAHYMVFYASVLAGITPPVAVSVVIASGIAGSNFWRSCGKALVISAPFFVLPISFVYHPELVSTVIDGETMITAALVMTGAASIIYGLNYPFNMSRWWRAPIRVGMFVLGVVVMVYPSWVVQGAGAAVLVGILITQRTLGSGHAAPIVSGLRESDD
ncbi:TRAP transporter permease [Halorubrum vacuolatum]|uniref:TRAP transporter, 4TM/12TM fusion protein n=1 Tax=Halorubrum vacuolatum TaxID=63740 RepID=A0A238VCG0_HALVU|nr:TRAP transporter fused permease subunit [Halorubrum vacuolatum]SNR31911.1 TRAP transporter, 4TM/12TM fusion protein [Halorubrum vacuolatum]